MTRAWAIGSFGGACIAFALVGCALFTDLQGFDCGADGCQDAGTDAAIDDRAATPDVAPSDAGDGGPEAGRCPEGRGPKMIVATSFCIDSTEVTGAQYEKFLEQALVFDAGPKPAICATDNTPLPGCGYDPIAQPNQPVRCISWCDAWAFCKWSGKRLCGRVGGGSLTPSESRDPSKSEWTAACSRFGQRAYAYGPTLDTTKCPASGKDAPNDVAASPGCEGGYPGLFDMNGNLEEWEDACQPADGGVSCQKRGNDYATSTGDCDMSFDEDVFEANADTGIRCCAD
jgi:sulfatase modifying factor 1